MTRLLPFALLLAFLMCGLVLTAHLDTSSLVPLDHEAIQYAKTPATDIVARLNEKLAARKARLQFDEGRGYLESLLTDLGIPAESQTLVFTKTSFQSPRIAPRTPRALYFNDEVSVGWVKGGDVLEVAALDPKQGMMFYTLEQEPLARPRLYRQDTCLQCHHTAATLGVPGLMLRSVHPEATGQPLLQAPSFLTTHESPLENRWGGWFVTGTGGTKKHMGNALVMDRANPTVLSEENTHDLTDLRRKFDTGAYLTPHSDIVALMVFEHQSQMINLMVRLGLETRVALHGKSALDEAGQKRLEANVESLLSYMLFAKEAPLTSKVTGTSGFQEVFPKSGKRDKQGRSLKDFELTTRLFKYPCSYMIYSDAFDGMPQVAKDRVYRRLWEILTADAPSEAYSRLSGQDRKNILEILRNTKSGLPEYWQAS